VATALSRRLDEPLDMGGRLARIGASIGLAMFPDDAGSVELLCVLADQRMYETKRSAALVLASADRRSDLQPAPVDLRMA
jgi:predicted signal transduction protein with EAL and GGDEF domain